LIPSQILRTSGLEERRRGPCPEGPSSVGRADTRGMFSLQRAIGQIFVCIPSRCRSMWFPWSCQPPKAKPSWRSSPRTQRNVCCSCRSGLPAAAYKNITEDLAAYIAIKKRATNGPGLCCQGQNLRIASVAQVLHHGLVTRAMLLLLHDALVPTQRVAFCGLLPAQNHVPISAARRRPKRNQHRSRFPECRVRADCTRAEPLTHRCRGRRDS